MRKVCMVCCFLFIVPVLYLKGGLFSQNVGIGTVTPNASAALEVQSTSKGMLIPRIALTAANVAMPVTAPADALLVYNTATTGSDNNSVTPGFYYWNAATSRWTAISGTATTNGNTGFGVWGDCAANGNISEYNPVADTASGVNGYFGVNVSVSGNYAIVGAYLEDVGANADQGTASIYQYTDGGWVFMQKLTDATGAAGDNFGRGVSISGNYAIVGAYSDNVGANVDQGSASIYQYNGSNWVLMQKITDAAGAAGDSFGFSVSISGNNAIVGAYLDNVGVNTDQGSVSIYQYNGSNWVQAAPITDALGAAGDQFGVSVSLAGNYAIVGGFSDDVGSNLNQGSVSIYQFNGSFWVLMQKITDATGTAGDSFGISVSVSGNYAMVGANSDDAGSNLDQGSASIYQYDGSSWVLMQKIIDGSGAGSDDFGRSVCISGNYAIVGTDGDDVSINTNQGSATIYQRIGAGWKKLQYVTDPGGNTNDNFGFSASVDGITKRFLTGAYGFINNSGSAVFGKIN